MIVFIKPCAHTYQFIHSRMQEKIGCCVELNLCYQDKDGYLWVRKGLIPLDTPKKLIKYKKIERKLKNECVL
jgi:hypothetical protein